MIELKVGDEVYEKQPRWFDNDYHPQVVTSIDGDNITVYEEGIKRQSVIKKSSFYLEDGNIIH